ncbi:hypothetical protein [Serratia oryzae]|uniref:Uncharacterized protein n=1 Tax=Serratia oryzae TaxID=2034155 RepID=A0A1S8CJM0_9GAMM|nr:hypothetical protein [Serratia oryzae]OMQ23510.1 hypothetical protein BMI79_08275 [Serratia oryzae]
MKKVLCPVLVALALFGASNSWGAPFVTLGAKGKAIATGTSAVAVAAAAALVAENRGDDDETTSTTTTTRTK